MNNNTTFREEFDVNGFGPFESINVTPEIIEWAKAALPAARSAATAGRHIADSAFLTRGAGQNALWHDAQILKWRVQELEALSRGRGLGISRNDWEKLIAFVASLESVEGK